MLAGLSFLAFELLLTHGPPTAWLKSGFKANPKLRLDQIDEAIRQAKSRLVGSLHLLIQVRSCVHISIFSMRLGRICSRTIGSMTLKVAVTFKLSATRGACIRQ